MNSKFKKLKPLVLSTAVMLALLTSSNLQAESLRSTVNKMFDFTTTSTGSQNFQLGNGRHVYSGGATSIRFRAQPFNVVNFQPPSANIGCGGIDFFEGSIDLMSSDQLIQAGRSIASAATVYAFRLALNSICSSCMSIMSNIQAMLQEFNRIAKTDCQSALNALEGWIPIGSDGADENNTEESILASINTQTGDWAESLSDNYNNWLDALAIKGMQRRDINNRNMTADLSGYPGFYYAHNTDLHKKVFPWLDEENGKNALWGLLSRSSLCPDENAASSRDGDEVDKTRAVLCSMGGEYTTVYSEYFFGGLEEGTDGAKAKEITLPECKSPQPRILEETKASVKVCESTTDGAVKKSDASVQPLFSQIMTAAYGANVDSIFKANVGEVVCSQDDKIQKSAGGLFTKLLTYDGEQLSPTELNLAASMGTTFTVDLYRVDNDGKLLEGDKRTRITCGERFEIFNTHLYRYMNNLVSGAERAITDAQMSLSNNFTLVLTQTQKNTLSDWLEDIKAEIAGSKTILQSVLEKSQSMNTRSKGGSNE